EAIGEHDRFIDLTIAIDKLDKIGAEGVDMELAAKGVPAGAIKKLRPFLELSGTNADKIKKLKATLHNTAAGMSGVTEMETLFEIFQDLNIYSPVEFDLTLARGLNYYTGTIFEVRANNAEIGSLCGGGRYDDLTGIFGLPDVSGVGVSFGADRIYDVMVGQNLFPEENLTGTKLMFVNFGTREAFYSLRLLRQIRQAGISAEIYPDKAKMKKQFSYADSKGIPYVAIVGEEEIRKEIITLKNMNTGEQSSVSLEVLIENILP
ncbi:MAG: ATP phosphoribosyltransferase regulatory subunit, partial [Bacteroidetes bacterium]|nr:ATP phosphoribosyltransferase regulatory subunit [Bacteroidota bacterium]